MASDKQQFTCGQCEETFSSEDQLDQHRSSHAWKQCYQCNFCSYTTPSINQMKEHAVTHSSCRKDPREESSDQEDDKHDETIVISDEECAAQSHDADEDGDAVILIESDNEHVEGGEGCEESAQENSTDLPIAQMYNESQSIAHGQSSSPKCTNAAPLKAPSSVGVTAEQTLANDTVKTAGNRGQSQPSRNIFAQLMGDFSVTTSRPSSPTADCVSSANSERQESQTNNDTSHDGGTNADAEGGIQSPTDDPGADIQCEVVSSSNSPRKKKGKKEKKLWTCKCGLKTYYRDNLRRHLRKGSCSQQKHNQYRLQPYMVEDAEKAAELRRFDCARCPFWSTTKQDLNQHQRTHHLKSYSCSECPFQTKHTSKLRRHMEMHEEEHMFHCTDCSFSSDHRNIVTRHMKLHEPRSLQSNKSLHSSPTCREITEPVPDESELECSMCTFTTRQGKFSLLEHEAEHYDDKRMRCDQCDLVTIDKRNFQSHLWSHEGQKPYKCGHCPYRTAHSKSLDRHLKNHDADLPFFCHLCSFSAKGQSALSAHLNVHGLGSRFSHLKSAESEGSSTRNLDDSTVDDCHSAETSNSFEATEVETQSESRKNTSGEDASDDGEEFYCKHCSFYAKDRYLLLLHAAKHSSDMLYHCDQCDFKSRHSVSLKEHLFVHLGQKPYKCTKDPRCPFETAHQGNLRSHIKTHTANFPMKCKFCTFTTVRQSVLTKHHRQHWLVKRKPRQEAKSAPTRTVYKCKYCEHTACSQHALMCHQAEHKNLRVFQCTKCQFSTNSRFIFMTHKNKHLIRAKDGMQQGDRGSNCSSEPSVQRKRFNCSTCSYTTDRKHLLLVHQAKHSGDRAFHCDECRFSTLSVHHLIQHLRTHERMKAKRYKCDECPYVAERQRSLINHKKNHNANLPFKCNQCSYTATKGYYIRVHTLLHIHNKKSSSETEQRRKVDNTDVNTVVDVDGSERAADVNDNDKPSKLQASGTNKIRLVMTGSGHYRTTQPSTPTGKRIYCDQCDHSTTRPRDMKVHARLHTGERPYACPDCPFRAIQSHHLQKHQTYHRANLAQKCKFCSFSCRSVSLLRSHVQLHTEKRNWHRCPHCNFLTSSYRVVQTHIKKQHVGLASSMTGAASAPPVQEKPPQEEPDVAGGQSSEEEADEIDVCDAERDARQSPLLQDFSYTSSSERLGPAVDKPQTDHSISKDTDSEKHIEVLSPSHEGDGTSSNSEIVEEGQVKCEQCEHLSATRVDHLIHLSTHNSSKKVHCDQCDYATCNKSLFKRHWQTHSFERLYKCALCPFTGTDRANLLEHESFHSTKQSLKCRWCSFSCSEQTLLDNHSRLHWQGRFKYKCQYCPFFTDKTFLHLVHKAKHSSTGIMKCNMCKFQTYDTNALKEHLGGHSHREHPTRNLSFLRRYKSKVYAEDDIYGCKLCPYKTFQPKSLIVHLSWHGANEAHKCPFCDFSHTRSYVIDDHKKLHGYVGAFKCNQCSYATDEKYRLLKHKAMHYGKKTFKCDQCDYSTDNSHRLRIHTTRHSGQNTLKCPHCPFETMSKSILNFHKLRHDGNYPVKCKYCTFSCQSEMHLSKHLKLHEKKTDLRCLKCDFVATSEISLSWHEVNHHKKDEEQPNEPVSTESVSEAPSVTETPIAKETLFGTWRRQKRKCPECPFVAQDINRLQDHVQKHGANLPYQCTQCSYSCERETDLTQHSRYHGVKGAFVCPECPYSTESNIALLLHQVLHSSDGMYSCDQCDLRTSDKEVLQSHMKEHDGTQVFRCSKCPYSTLIQSSSVVHQRRHHVRLPLSCKYCSYSTGKQKDIDQHTKMHERKFHCTECTYTTDSRYQFLVHKGFHTEEKIFSCDKCSFKTKTVVALRSHLANQCNKKLRCSECPFVTSRRLDLTSHMKYHNVNLRYKCTICSFSTALGWHFNRHAKLHKKGTRQLGPKGQKRQKPSTSSAEQHDCQSDNEEQAVEPALSEGDPGSDVEVEIHDTDEGADRCETPEEQATANNNSTGEQLEQDVDVEGESSEVQVMEAAGPSTPTTTSRQTGEQTVFSLVKSYASYHLSCRFCPYKTSKRIHLQSHEAKHGADLPLKCSKCSYSDRFEGQIANHMRVHGCPGKYQCPHCYYSTDKEGFLQVHMNSRHRTSKVFQCSKCDFTTERPKYLKEHIFKQHLCKAPPTKVEVLEYKCIRCSFQAATLGALWDHHKSQHKEEENHYYRDGVYRCRHCSYVAHKQHRMSKHVRIHLRDLAYTPKPREQQADKGTEDSSETTEVDVEKLSSDEDDEGLQSLSYKATDKTWEPHSLPYGIPPEEDEKASDEKTAGKSKNTARKSVSLFTTEKSEYRCPDCDYTTTTASLMLVHAQNNHSKEPEVETQKVAHYPRHLKLFKCYACPYSSYRKVHVSIHEKYHTANYPFKCDQCTYTCQFLYKLLQHKALHERGQQVAPPTKARNITVYKCPLCPYTSYKKMVVQEHKTYHRAGLPHKCSVCTYSCKTDAKLQDHMKLHSNQYGAVDQPQEKPTVRKVSNPRQASMFQCSMCPYTSYKSQHIYCHERLHYANLPNRCSFCTYSSIYEYKLKQHQKLHEVEAGENVSFKLSGPDKDESQDAPCSTVAKSSSDAYPSMQYGEENRMATLADVTAVAQFEDTESQSESLPSRKRGLNYVFDNSDRYQLRAEGRISIRLFRCAKCHFYSKSWRLLQLHKAQHELKMIRMDSMKSTLPAAKPDRAAVEGLYHCRYCPYGSTHISHVWRHEERHNAGLPFKCRYCSYSSLLEYWTDRHEAVHKEEKQVEAIQDIRDLQVQPEERSPVFAYGDDKLFAGIDTEEELATNSDSSDDTYSCKLCGRKFEEWRAYERHARQHRQAGGEHVKHAVALGDPFTGRVFYVFTCKLCGRRFTGQVEWIQHMQHHRRNNRVPDRR